MPVVIALEHRLHTWLLIPVAAKTDVLDPALLFSNSAILFEVMASAGVT
jgi:hypothetical protein